MNPDVKEQWLTALRSGEYKQGHSQLRIERPGSTQHCRADLQHSHGGASAMTGHIFDESDHLALQQAAQLVNEVIERNRATLTLPALAFLCEAVHDMDMADKYMMPEQREGVV